MFTTIARFDIRFRWLIVAAWIAAVLTAVTLLPSLASVTQTNTAQFLAPSSPSIQAGALAAPFRGLDPSGTALILAYRADGPLTAADTAALRAVEQAVRSVPGVALVTEAGTAPDGQVSEALVTVPAATASNAVAAQAVVTAIRASFAGAGAPPGLSWHLAGPLAASVDAATTGSTTGGNITRFTLLFVIVLLFLVYRAVLAPLITLLPAALAVALAGPLIAAAAQAGLAVAEIAQQLLIVLLLGAGADYGLFLCFRVREELARGSTPPEALVTAVARVGEAITYSALTVAAALLTLLLAPFGLYQGLGPALAIGIAVLLAASLTLTPALLAIFGRAAFWPVPPKPGPPTAGLWGRVAARVVGHPVLMLAAGVVLFGALAAGLIGYRTGGLTSSAPSTSDSAAGAAVLAAHFPQATGGADQVLLRFATPVWDNPAVLTQAQTQLAGDPVFRAITGPLGAGRGVVSAAPLAGLYQTLGPAAALPPTPPAGSPVPPQLYAAYRATSRFISPDGRTVQYYTALSAGPAGSTAAAAAIPGATADLAAIARTTGAAASGIAGPDAAAYDITTASNTSLALVVPAVLVLILILLALLLRSLVAPWYLALTVGLSYLAALGFAMIVFVHLGGSDGLIFALPLLMFVFAMALGEDYNILIMSRIREEAHHAPTLAVALTRAIGITGGTITAAGIILAGTFAVLGVAGGRSDAQQLGFSIAFGVILDTFFVRTLLIPSIALLLGRWNWWPSALSRPPVGAPPAAPPGLTASQGTDPPAAPAAGSPS
ncbi:MAG TPA: MMPL family transporter [Chloroflexia bacterium]|nr:MMPL family transporter [Chloroflexia bacterium]